MEPQKVTALSDNVIRKLCTLERSSQFADAAQPNQQIVTLSSKPFQRYVITQQDGEIGDKSDGALEPCGMAYARELFFEIGESGSELSKGCWKPCKTPVQKIYDSHGQTFALQGDMVLACLSDQGRLETFAAQGTTSISARFRSGGQFEVYRCGESTGFLITAEIGDQEFEEDEEALLNFTPIYNYDDCEECGCWEACKKKDDCEECEECEDCEDCPGIVYCCTEDSSSGESNCIDATAASCAALGGNSYGSMESCLANCGEGYVCEDNRNCKPVPMSDAEFQTLEECEGECGCCCFDREGVVFGDFTFENSGTVQGSSASFTNIIGTSSASFSTDLPDPFCPKDSGSFTATVNYSYSSSQPAIDGSLAQIFFNVVGQQNSTQFVDGLPPNGSHTFNFDASPCGTITIFVGFTDFQEEATGELIESPSHNYLYERSMTFDACDSANLTARSGVGTALQAALKSRGAPSCTRCNSLAIEMDRKGVQWCEEKFESLVDEVFENAKRMKGLRGAIISAIAKTADKSEVGRETLKNQIRSDLKKAIAAAKVVG